MVLWVPWGEAGGAVVQEEEEDSLDHQVQGEGSLGHQGRDPWEEASFLQLSHFV